MMDMKVHEVWPGFLENLCNGEEIWSKTLKIVLIECRENIDGYLGRFGCDPSASVGDEGNVVTFSIKSF